MIPEDLLLFIAGRFNLNFDRLNRFFQRKSNVLSAGVGRTGTYLAIDPLMELIDHKKPIDICQRVIEMRTYRPKMVQNPVNLLFIFVLIYFIL